MLHGPASGHAGALRKTLGPAERDAAAAGDATPRRLKLAVAALFCVVLAAGWWTRDFGRHWDEGFQVEMVQRTASTGTFLPGWYRYPSLTYWLSLASIAPSAAASGFEREAVIAEAASPRFKLRGRLLYWTVAYLALFWVACLAWRVTRSEPAAFLAALVLALSFEFHYHARWMTSDAINAQLVVAAVLLAVIYHASGRTGWLVAAAAVVGLAIGAKYPGGLALAPLGLAILYRHGRRPGRAIAYGCGALAIALAVFLLTTPGAVLEHELFQRDVEQELRHYRERGHLAYTVEPGLPHLARMLVYLGVSALSFQPAIALGLCVLALVGAAALARRDRRLAGLLVVLPLVYLLYFSTQRVMAVRNLQVLMPLLAVLAAVGMHACLGGMRSPAAKRLALAALGVALAWNAWWLARADLSIVRRGSIDRAAEVAAYVRAAPRPVFLGSGLRDELGAEVVQPLVDEGRVTLDVAQADKVVLYVQDVPLSGPSAAQRFIANRPGTYGLLPSGPWEVNWDYYPSWSGDQRPIVISSRYYRDLAGLP
jgi:4-amino-4-deoxy-L-arabinose transferase-like glycosyltransferase